MQAQRERDRKVKAEAREQIRQGNALSSVNRPRPYCSDLWKQYRECKRRMMIAEQAKIERLLREKGCWFRGRLHVTNKQRENAEKRDSEIA